MSVPELTSAGPPDPCVPVLQVLALDGGGLRGIFTAATLAAWEEDFDTPIADHFDLIVGTSTGGVIALALGIGISPSDILSIYVDHGDHIFPPARRTRRGLLRRLRRARYSANKLRAVLKDSFGDRTLGDSEVRLAIPSYDLAADHVHLFRTPHHPDLRRDWRVPVVDVALATTAAPTFLPAHRMEAHRLIDGGVWANNPALVGVAECFDRLGGERGHIRILSVGTSSEIRDRRPSLDNGGLLTWRSDSLNVMLRGQCLAATNHARLILGRHNLLRVDVSTPVGLHTLDLVTPRDLIGRARAESRTRSPALADFLTHSPSPYKPYYRKEHHDGQ
ncbi:MAG: CBASS cGAMP-activated phospholipase [bacterium]|nr:CBASS cGAMP-activated phospholipase [bacterium]MDE0351164.1 CBASS cGAMP-activated phospholipase [bacterium]